MSILTSRSRVGVAPVKLPARSPDLNSFAERWVKSDKGMSLEVHPVRREVAPSCA